MAASQEYQLAASRFAYADFNDAFKHYKNNGSGVTIKELIQYNIKYKSPETNYNLASFSDYIEINGDSFSFKDGYEYLESWKMDTYIDKNGIGQSGLYATIINTGNDRILATRGSESMFDLRNLNQDWFNADLELLQKTQTAQEADLREFMKRGDVKALLNEKHWCSTGHSLGGNLADSVAIAAAELKDKYGNFLYDFSKYDGVSNFDGPGHTQEYYKLHNEAIQKLKEKKVTRFIASAVGNIFDPIPGADEIYIETTDGNVWNDSDDPSDDFHKAGNHCMEHWIIGKDGKLIEREPTVYDGMVRKITTEAEKFPSGVRYLLIEGIKGIWTAGIVIANIANAKNPLDVINAICGGIAMHIMDPMSFVAGAALFTAIVSVAAYLVLNVFLPIAVGVAIAYVAKEVCKALCDALDWLKGKIDELYNAVMETINTWIKSLREMFNRGVSYVRNNPYFSADTVKLREYANRLANVNRRLRTLDREMRSLYWQVGLLDIWDIICCNLITSPSYSLDKAKNYLNNTTNRLEKAENKAKGHMGG